jgi:hypothetical protein
VKAMRKILILLILTTLISCKNETKKKDTKLIGEWGIYIHYISGLAAACNVCPKISFNDFNIAELTLPSGETELYEWKSSNKLLNLKFLGNENMDQYFSNSEYGLEFKKKENFTELILLLNDKERFVIRK